MDTPSALQAVVEALVKVGNPAEALRWARTADALHEDLVRTVLSTALGGSFWQFAKFRLCSLIDCS